MFEIITGIVIGTLLGILKVVSTPRDGGSSDKKVGHERCRRISYKEYLKGKSGDIVYLTAEEYEDYKKKQKIEEEFSTGKRKKSLWYSMWHDDSIGTTYPGYKSLNLF